MEFAAIKDAIEMASPLTQAIVASYLTPKLVQLAKNKHATRQLDASVLSENFSQYLLRAYERQSYLKTVVFQNNKVLLKSLYIPLTITNSATDDAIIIDTFPSSLLPAHGKVLLVDTAGMGKSTLSRFLFLNVVETNKGIPLFIELRQLREGTTLLDIIANDLSSIDQPFDKDVLLKLIKRGDFIFFLDGFDEIPIDQREFATRHLQDFITKAVGNQFLLTSRQDPALAAFADFQRFVIQPLTRTEAFALLRKYDVQGTTAPPLIEKLEAIRLHSNERSATGRGGQVDSFLTNPLLVSLLFKAYDFKPTLPLRADVFYRQVYEALFENHDISKGDSFVRDKYTHLNLDDFARVLRVLAMRTATLGKVEYTADELSGFIREARARCAGLTFSEADFIRDLTRTVPLFVQDGNYLRWSHKSFQEYFAALYIAADAKGDAERILVRFASSAERQRFANILELYYDIDKDTFQRALLRPLLNDFVTYVDTTYGNCESVNAESINIRKRLCFARQYVIFPAQLVEDLKLRSGSESDGRQMFAEMELHCLREKLACSDCIQETSTHWAGDGGVVMYGRASYLVMQILDNKRDPLVERIEISGSALSDCGKGHAAAPSDVLGGKLAMIVTDDATSTLNSPAKFSCTSIVLMGGPTAIGLDETVCRQTLSAIEAMMSRDPVDDFLSGI